VNTEFAKVLKFNPNHGKDGRFTSGKAGGGGPVVDHNLAAYAKATGKTPDQVLQGESAYRKAWGVGNATSIRVREKRISQATPIMPSIIGGAVSNKPGDGQRFERWANKQYRTNAEFAHNVERRGNAGRDFLYAQAKAFFKPKPIPNAKPGEAKTAPIPNASGKPTLSNYDSARDGKKWRIDSSDKTLNSTERAIARALDERADRNKPNKRWTLDSSDKTLNSTERAIARAMKRRV